MCPELFTLINREKTDVIRLMSRRQLVHRMVSLQHPFAQHRSTEQTVGLDHLGTMF